MVNIHQYAKFEIQIDVRPGSEELTMKPEVSHDA